MCREKENGRLKRPWRINPGQTLWQLLESLAVACFAATLALAAGMLLRPVLASQSGLAALPFLSAWGLLAGWLPWTRGRLKPSAALAALVASTVWIVPSVARGVLMQPPASRWLESLLGLLKGI